MAIPPKVHFHKLTLSGQKDLLLSKKRNYKVSSLQIPMKGSSTLSDYSIETVLKTSKPSSYMFKMLRKMKAHHISDGFLKFFAKNKQVLKGIRSLSAGIGSLPADRTFQFAKLVNSMKYMQQIDDLAKFSIREVMKQRGFTFKPPHKLISKSIGGRRAAITGDHALCLKKVHPFRHVEEIQFSPHLNLKRLFPSIKQIAIEAMFLDKLSEVTRAKPTRLIVTDSKSFGLTSAEPNWEALKKIQTVKDITLSLTEPENLDLLEVISGLPKRELNLSMNFALDALVSKEECLSSLVEFIIETNSKVHFNLENWPTSQDFLKVLQAIDTKGCQQLVTFSKLVFDAEYSLELQKLALEIFMNSKNSCENVLIKVIIDDARQGQDFMIGPYIHIANQLEEMNPRSEGKERKRDKTKKNKKIMIQEDQTSKASSE